ncbi:MAG: 23S rRNA (adenine(2503)-C(2))-methyltransferase RlmN [Clostridia bacterium]|nr:23S rRNA (adenine(2503)-C(2))-methyltransferase RlmN [Clostridia bacterium]
MTTELLGLTPEELQTELSPLGEKPFRAKQIFSWLQRGMRFSEMSNLPLALREKLASLYVDQPVEILERHVSQMDGTVKLLYALRDQNCVEGVVMRYHYGVTLCLSTQVGCAMGCAFCASTLDGCVRSLTAAEMLGQVMCADRMLAESGERVSHIVLMGSGEPLQNYDNVVRFLRLVSHPEGKNIGLRHISLSTCGLPAQIRRLADEGLPVTLSLSLHAPNDRIRQRLMPVAKRYTIEETLDACRYYLKKIGRRIILEYALIDKVNADQAHALELARLLRGMQCHVNLIPLNTVRERNLFGVTEGQVTSFLNTLTAQHISATRRREMGDDIQGACGQLRQKHLKEQTT